MIFYKKLQSIKAMTFDLDDTFYDNHPFIKKAEAQLFEYLFSRFPRVEEMGREAWRTIRREVVTSQPVLNHDMVRLRKTILTHLLTQAGVPQSDIPTEVQFAFDYFYEKRSDFTVKAEYCDLLSWLSQRIPLIAITNGNVDLARIGIADYFQTSLHASINQPMKPHRKMFDMASEELALPPSQILHIGDNLKKDVAGAQMAGFQSAWFAEDRRMDIRSERVSLLPHVQLSDLQELKLLL